MKINILHISKPCKNLWACICMLLAITLSAKAQQVTVDASIDSLQLLIGEQTKIKL